MTAPPQEEVAAETSNEEAPIAEDNEKTSAPKSEAALDETPVEVLSETEASPKEPIVEEPSVKETKSEDAPAE